MSKTFLLDVNVLVALLFPDHLFHKRATNWVQETSPSFATCPITQGGVVRFAVRTLQDGPRSAQDLLSRVTALPSHEFWLDDLHYKDIEWRKVFGYRQVTDAYLVALADHHGGVLATLDSALAAIYPQVLLIEP